MRWEVYFGRLELLSIDQEEELLPLAQPDYFVDGTIFNFICKRHIKHHRGTTRDNLNL